MGVCETAHSCDMEKAKKIRNTHALSYNKGSSSRKKCVSGDDDDHDDDEYVRHDYQALGYARFARDSNILCMCARACA